MVFALVNCGGQPYGRGSLDKVDIAGGKQWMTRWPRLFCFSAAGARGVLSTIAGAMMAVVGVTFSRVTLALAVSQYTSRILRNFMRDSGATALSKRPFVVSL